MSPLAKVFVVFVLFLSVSFLASSAALFSTRKPYKTEIETMSEAWSKAVAKYTETIRERDSSIASLETDKAGLERHRDDLKVQNAALTSAKEQLDLEHRTLKSNYDRELATNEKNARTLEAIAAERDALTKRNDELRQQTDAAVKEAIAATQSATRITLDFNQTAKQLGDTQTQLAEVTRDRDGAIEIIERAKQRWGAAMGDLIVSEPPPAIDAQVVKVSPDDASVVILSCGDEDGIKEGHELTIYRGDVFVAKAKVERVTTDLSAAKVVFLQGGPVQTGDKATTRLSH